MLHSLTDIHPRYLHSNRDVLVALPITFTSSLRVITLVEVIPTVCVCFAIRKYETARLRKCDLASAIDNGVIIHRNIARCDFPSLAGGKVYPYLGRFWLAPLAVEQVKMESDTDGVGLICCGQAHSLSSLMKYEQHRSDRSGCFSSSAPQRR